MITAGIDAGSRAVKIVLFDTRTETVIGRGLTDQTARQALTATRLLADLLQQHRLVPSDLGGVVATGYGRHGVTDADRAVTEITCHARGVRQSLPDVRTIVEVGGQDSKAIHLEPDGTIRDFEMNDRCAAGTGRFLEVLANRLDMDVTHLGALAGQSTQPASISSTCVVFAETEIIGLLADDASPADIIAGVQASVAARLAHLAGRCTPPVAFTGGVALIDAMADAVTRAVGLPVTVPEHPQFTGALGAALLAAEK